MGLTPGRGTVRRLRKAVAAPPEMMRCVRRAARAHEAAPWAVARRARRLRRARFEYREALAMGLLDPALPDAVCDGHVSRHLNMSTQLRLNGAEMPPLVGDKLVFARYCEALGLPAPRLVAAIDRDGVVDLSGGGWPEEVVVKPARGYEGLGVRVLRRAGLDLAALRAELARDRRWHVWLVQERLRNDHQLATMAGDRTLHTLRIVTLVGRDGGVDALWACLKLGLGGGAADNFRGGGAGNTLCMVDVRDGRLGPALVPRADGCGHRSADRLDDGTPVAGVALEGWTAARDLVLAASPAFLPLRTLGWDLALTPGGPVVVEANTRWGAAPSAAMRAAVARLEREAPSPRRPPARRAPAADPRAPLVADRALLLRYCALAGLPSPALHAIVGRGVGWRRGDRPLADASAFAEAVAGLPERFVVAPATGPGSGRVVERAGLVPEALYEELVTDPSAEAFVIREHAAAHPELAALASERATLRVRTRADGPGAVVVVSGELRRPEGMVAPVAPGDGRIGGSGAVVPEWAATVALVRRAAERLLPARDVAWDLSITASGPLILGAG